MNEDKCSEIGHEATPHKAKIILSNERPAEIYIDGVPVQDACVFCNVEQSGESCKTFLELLCDVDIEGDVEVVKKHRGTNAERGNAFRGSRLVIGQKDDHFERKLFERKLLQALNCEIASLPYILSFKRRKLAHQFILDCFDRMNEYMGASTRQKQAPKGETPQQQSPSQ